MTVVVTGIGLAVPGVETPAALLDPRPAGPRAVEPQPVEPRERVGKKGLRYKDRATQLAYCAARDALDGSGLLGADGRAAAGETVAVVASSNYGNVDTVCRAVDTIARETAAGGSPMDLPNASSNVVASSVAIRFGLRGPNLMLCNGATSGLDAVHWAATLIGAGRAARALVVGVEPDNAPVRALVGGLPVIDGAVALLLETGESAAARGAEVRARLGGYIRGASLAGCLDRLADATGRPPGMWQPPEGTPVPDGLLPGVPRLPLRSLPRVASGALGVLQCAAAAGWFARGGDGPVFAVSGGHDDDASAAFALLPPAPDREPAH